MELTSTLSEVSSTDQVNSFLHVKTCDASTNDNDNDKNMKSSRESTPDRIKRLKQDMLKIRKDQKSIRKSQRQARKKLGFINKDLAFIKSEAEEVARLSERIQQRLNLIFMILEARKNNDNVKANILVGSLRLLLSSTTNSSTKY
ncbi:hypothetical protein ACFE04_027736 [Oxalis oulophora]